MPISPGQRFSDKTHRCPICSGWDKIPRGQGKRCFGFISNDRNWAHCTRKEYAGELRINPETKAFAHRLEEECSCGISHNNFQAEISNSESTRRRIDAIYDYLRPDGEILFQVVRYQPKDFAQRRPNGKGGWIWNLKGIQPVLYRLPELLSTTADTTVFIQEGEKDVDAVRSLGVTATCNPGGAGNFTSAIAQPLAGRSTVIVADKDGPGRSHAQKVAKILHEVGCRTKVLELPGDAVKDASDWIAAGGTREELEALIPEAQDWTPVQAPVDQQKSDQRSVIVVTNRHLRDIVDDTWNALSKANDPPYLFQRGHLLVDIIQNDLDQPLLRTLDRPGLKGLVDRIADFVKVGKEGQRPARPPTDVIADMIAGKELPLPVLLGITGCPIIGPSGMSVATPGYQPETRYFLDLANGLSIPGVPAVPRQFDVRIARNILLCELLTDFPFVTESDLANAVAALLLPFVRLLVDGPTPLHLIESPTPGTGKGLLVDALTIPSIGQGTSVMTEGRGEEEWRKRLTAKLLSAPQYILIDNVRSRLDSAALSAALTSEIWEDRVLGYSRTAAIPVKCVWLATSNNPGLSLEIARRTVPIRIDSGQERPWEDRVFKHPKLKRWARKNRGQLIWAALTLCRAWITEGRPAGQQSLGTYESYAEVMGGILDVAGIPGFLGNLDRSYQEADQEVQTWGELCAAWWREFGSRNVPADLVLGLAMREKLLLDIWGGRNDHGARTRFGKALSRMRDRIIGGYRIRRAGEDTHSKVLTYSLERIETRDAGVAGGCGGFSGSKKSWGAGDPGDADEAMDEPSVQMEIKVVAETSGRQKTPANPRNPRNDPWDSFLEEGGDAETTR